MRIAYRVMLQGGGWKYASRYSTALSTQAIYKNKSGHKFAALLPGQVLQRASNHEVGVWAAAVATGRGRSGPVLAGGVA